MTTYTYASVASDHGQIPAPNAAYINRVICFTGQK